MAIDPCEVGSHVVVAASLMGTRPKAARGIGMAGSSSTEVNDSSRDPALLKRDRTGLSRSYRLCDAAIEPAAVNSMAWLGTTRW